MRARRKTRTDCVFLILSLATAAATWNGVTGLVPTKWQSTTTIKRSLFHRRLVVPPLLAAASLDDNGVVVANQSDATVASPEQEQQRGGISMHLAELADVLGGMGRAQLVWDCYRMGVDPALYFGESNINTGNDDMEHDGNDTAFYQEEPESVIQQGIASCRRTQRLGKDALEKLASLYGTKGRLEGGVATLSHISTSSDQTTKLLLRLADGLEVETVIIPWKSVRSTLCVSSQIGCRQGCTFCATGRMGKLRSLTSDEILAQLFFARKMCRLHDLPRISNVVFMGMGDAADPDVTPAVLRALEIMTTRELYQLSQNKVTVSTVAPSPDAFSKFAKAPCVLAWSVHAVDDALRRKLVPTTKYTMIQLRQGLMDALLQRPLHFRTVMMEVALCKNVNDSLSHAEELADFGRGLVTQVPGCKLVVNLIPVNAIDTVGSSVGAPRFEKPSPTTVTAFQKRLWAQGIFAHVRATRGDDESAACGQLATTKKRQGRKQASAAAAAIAAPSVS